MGSKESMEGLKRSQDLLFKRPYLWIITISITSLNFLITYDFQKIDSLYFYYYLVDILTTYLIIEFYALGIRILNKRVPLNQDFIKRVAYQLTLHTLSVILFSVVLNELFDYIFFEGERLSLSFVFYTKDTIVALVFVLFFHVIYFALFFMSNQENLESLKIIPEVKLKVTDAYATKFLYPKEVVVVYSLFGITYVVGSDQNKYTSELTLKEFEEKLDDSFFRANRKHIISRASIDSYKSSINGKVEVKLKIKGTEDLSETIIVSRDKASFFRSWLNSSS
jgi:DNA-binding LytR/AlgR family response regulator